MRAAAPRHLGKPVTASVGLNCRITPDHRESGANPGFLLYYYGDIKKMHARPRAAPPLLAPRVRVDGTRT
jgi:hypothetical protein